MRKWAGSVQVTMTVMAGWSGLFPPLFGEKRVLCLTLKAIRLLLTLLFSLPVFSSPSWLERQLEKHLACRYSTQLNTSHQQNSVSILHQITLLLILVICAVNFTRTFVQDRIDNSLNAACNNFDIEILFSLFLFLVFR